ncbi:DNA mismatch repair domain protein [[Clostridium] methylpentosum DSM 5476]|uniref:DNA mismatch repair protein MutL n=1 Tax=[Clostridium] methylpentosum DSM 5476 TaxID=537013 RepID=C0EF23_9FIRM|nr:DNA mismatch repair domain protein [[Clostridium] methylpentosum DSM 5476]MDY3988553.1 DNA mismatch repair endonuclease MutL [Massilioclostridium sp.]
MPQIHLLDKAVSELIAAGEVIERPASIVKELLENSIDSGATSVTVEIKTGGKQLIRITDNGCGISPDDVPKAFLRHATSKIQTEPDLEHIATLGFRGEALASICAVSKIELLTKTAEEQFGTRYTISGGEGGELEETGCPDGTTILVREIFYDVPARLKFLKKDVTEGNAIQSIVDKIALSHPEISIKFLRDGKRVLNTPGNGDRFSVIHAVFGREFASTLMPVDYKAGSFPVNGFASVPMKSRANRSMQHFFINGRYVKSKTCCTALEEAYKGSIMVGKFPACVLNLELPFEMVDVNVHPSKIEVRFTDERAVFEAVYFAVKSAIAQQSRLSAVPRETEIVKPHVERVLSQPQELDQMGLGVRPTPQPISVSAPPSQLRDSGFNYQVRKKEPVPQKESSFSFLKKESFAPAGNTAGQRSAPKRLEDRIIPETPEMPKSSEVVLTKEQSKHQPEKEARPVYRIIGELFKTYILAEVEDQLVMVDKHAAHERILYEKLKQEAGNLDRQVLLAPVSVTCSVEEHECILANAETLERLGFLAEDFGGSSVLIREIPMVLDREAVEDVFGDILNNLMKNKRDVSPQVLEELYHSMACKAAIKANDVNSPAELERLFERVYFDEAIRYCPHGRPVAITMTKERFERQFGR